VALAAVVLCGCVAATLTQTDWQDPAQLAKGWPAPPGQKRIGLLRVVGASSGADKSGGRLFLDWLLGEKREAVPLVSPYGVAADGLGRIWLADPGSGAVHGFNLATGEQSIINRAGEEGLVSPTGVVFSAGQLFVADSVLNRVFVFDPDGTLLGERSPPEGFGRPVALAVDTGKHLLVVDVVAGILREFDADGNFVRNIGCPDDPEGRFRFPVAVTVDSSNRIYVTDSMRFRIVVLSSAGDFLTSIGEIGTGTGTFARPRGVAVDSSGHVYVVDAAFDNVQIFDMAGQLLLFFGHPGKAGGELCLPSGIFIDGADRIYVADSCNQRLQVFQYFPVAMP